MPNPPTERLEYGILWHPLKISTAPLFTLDPFPFPHLPLLGLNLALFPVHELHISVQNRRGDVMPCSTRFEEVLFLQGSEFDGCGFMFRSVEYFELLLRFAFPDREFGAPLSIYRVQHLLLPSLGTQRC